MTAGLGTRMRPITDRVPKPFVPLMGIPICQFPVLSLDDAGVSTVVTNIHHLPKESLRGLSKLNWSRMSYQVSDESKLLLGSGGALVRNASLWRDEPFFYMNGDVACDCDLRELARRHHVLRRRYGVLMTLHLIPESRTGESYTEICLDEARDRVAKLGERKKHAALFSGVAVIEPEILGGLEPGKPYDFVSDLLRPALDQNRVGAFEEQSLWLDLGNPRTWAWSHFAMMDSLEKGDLSLSWRRWIERFSVRVKESLWRSKECRLPRGGNFWTGPGYWAGSKRKGVDEFSHSIVYGDADLPREVLDRATFDSFQIDLTSS